MERIPVSLNITFQWSKLALAGRFPLFCCLFLFPADTADTSFGFLLKDATLEGALYNTICILAQGNGSKAG